MATRRPLSEPVGFTVGLIGFSGLMWAAIDLARWILPLALLAYFWPLLLSAGELERRRTWPPLYYFPVETAIAFIALAVAYLMTRHTVDHVFFGILGGALAGFSAYLRLGGELDRRGATLDRQLGLISNYVHARRWRSRDRRLPL